MHDIVYRWVPSPGKLMWYSLTMLSIATSYGFNKVWSLSDCIADYLPVCWKLRREQRGERGKRPLRVSHTCQWRHRKRGTLCTYTRNVCKGRYRFYLNWSFPSGLPGRIGEEDVITFCLLIQEEIHLCKQPDSVPSCPPLSRESPCALRMILLCTNLRTASLLLIW